jgi:hypothetical protein
MSTTMREGPTLFRLPGLWSSEEETRKQKELERRLEVLERRADASTLPVPTPNGNGGSSPARQGKISETVASRLKSIAD